MGRWLCESPWIVRRRRSAGIKMDEVEERTGGCLRERIMNDSGAFKFQMERYTSYLKMCMMVIFSFAEVWQ